MTAAFGTPEAMRALVEWTQSSTTAMPQWQRDALRRLYEKCPLSSSSEDELFAALCQIHQLSDSESPPAPVRPIDITHIPDLTNVVSSVAIHAISDIHRVNAIAAGQKVRFETNGLTVIFGNNGAGKSGYARILKSACRARADSTILPNVYDEKPVEPPTAKISFSVAGRQEEFIWQHGKTAHSALSLASVFDSHCASVHVDEKNEAAYTPLPLQILKELSELCRRFKGRLQSMSASLQSQVPISLRDLKCSRTTMAGKFLHNLSTKSSLAEATALATMTAEEIARLSDLTSQLSSDPRAAIAQETGKLRRLNAIVDRMADLESNLGQAAVARVEALIVNAISASQAAHLAATQAFTDDPLSAVGGETWKALWQAAKAYSEKEAYPGREFPVKENGVCVLCQQTLHPEAQNRMSRFQQFVQQNAQQLADKASEALSAAVASFEKLQLSKAQLETELEFLTSELQSPETAEVVRAFLDSCAVTRDHLIQVCNKRAWTAPTQLAACPLELIRVLVKRVTDTIEQLQKAADPDGRRKLISDAKELEDRAFLKEVVADVEREISRRKKLARIEAATEETDTSKITRKSTELADSLITAAWRDQFAAEVSRLEIHHLRIELQRESGSYGAAKFRVALIRDSSVKLGIVLSEGEYRCIALAAFFAELATSEHQSSLIFDDPVSSLDHDHRDAVARRLAEEAATGRQVIVFTHDVFFLDLLSRHAKQCKAKTKFLTVNRLPSGDHCGAIDDGVPSSVAPAEDLAEGVRRQVKQFENLYNLGRLVKWNEQTNSFSNQLRKCWERAVAEALSPVVERFNTAVNTKNLWQIAALEESDCVTMRQAYKRCSELNHEKCAELGRTDPKPDDYYNEVDTVVAWIQAVRAKQLAAQAAHPIV